MKKTLLIEGMTCAHCQARVEKALNSLEDVKAKVNLKKSLAVVKSKVEIEDSVLIEAVSEAGYKVVSIN